MSEELPIKKKRVMPMGRRFKKGEVANPLGAGAHNPAMKLLKRMSQTELEIIGSKVLGASAEELQAMLDDEKVSVLTKVFVKILLRSLRYPENDTSRLASLLDRIVGKVQDKIEYSGALDMGPVNKGTDKETMMQIIKDPEATRLARELALRLSQGGKKDE